MVLVASGRGRRRGIVAALFAALAGDAAQSERLHAHSRNLSAADELVVHLFDQEAASLVRLARLFTDDRNAAEDLVQEAFIRLHRSADRIQDPAKAAPYLRSIVLNLARDHNRRGLMSLRHRSAMEPDVPSAPMEDLVVDSVDHQRVIDALRDLAPRQRDCLVLRFYFGLTEREIGAELGISANSVKTHCRRGLAHMELHLGGPQ